MGTELAGIIFSSCIGVGFIMWQPLIGLAIAITALILGIIIAKKGKTPEEGREKAVGVVVFFYLVLLTIIPIIGLFITG